MARCIAALIKASFVVSAMICAGAASAATATPAAVAITNVLTTSAKAWGKGDLDGFMQSHEDSPRITYVTGKNVLHGFAAVRAVYAPLLTGPGANAGALTVNVDSVEAHGNDYALTIGHFRLTPRDGNGSSGIFTLIFHRSAKGWRFISDHSS